jgi:2,3-diketo-5-methylthio-1-phosphopentane phosphatase
VSARPPGTKAILLDIEGTTTPLTFVTDVLFPYARAHLRAHLEEHDGSPGHASILVRLRQDYDIARERGETPPAWTEDSREARLASAVSFAEWLMDRDQKVTALKELQGYIWEDGYRRGALVGQVFADVAPALRRWRAGHAIVGIYSSGSVLAQQMLFRHSSAGDLTPWITSYFDTNMGAKADPASYRRIAAQLDLPEKAILFVSDAPRELAAASDAGLSVRLAVRPGNASVPDGQRYVAVRSFDDF